MPAPPPPWHCWAGAQRREPGGLRIMSSPDGHDQPIASLFTPGQLECLVRTAGEAVHSSHADRDSLSRRQIILAGRAYRALLAEFETAGQQREISLTDLRA